MPAPTQPFPPSLLETRINILSTGKARKPSQRIESLLACPLKEMVQFDCAIKNVTDKNPQGVAVCRPLVRLFRRCADGTTVETTSWETEN